jgi:outer membrane protein OmpA-like peptidoglycan-associated protein
MRAFLIAMIILLQGLLGYFYFKDYARCCASKEDITEITDNVDAGKVSGPLLFDWSAYDPKTTDLWARYKDSLISAVGAENKLEITAWKCEGETPEALGMQRVAAVRALFSELPDERIIITSVTKPCNELSKNNPFIAAEFSVSSASENIKETETKTLIYFGSNSVEKLNSKDVEVYLNDVAAKAISSGDKIGLVGHTDNIGSEAANVAIGLKRAETIKKYLVSKGVPADKISTDSKGETQPVADNSTEEGRAKNRRTELTIIK